MKLYPLAFAAALLPLFTIHLCYVLAANSGHVDWCIPYIDSCTSISATGRKPPAFFVFKGLMIPAAVILLMYWYCSCYWLASLGCAARLQHRIILSITVVACLGLILYSVMLGAIGDIYQLQRRIGVTTFFGLSYIGQLLVTHRLSTLDTITRYHQRELTLLKSVSLVIMLIGIASIVFQAVDDDYYDTKEDAFEWTFTLLLCTHVLISAVLWKKTGFMHTFASAQKT